MNTECEVLGVIIHCFYSLMRPSKIIFIQETVSAKLLNSFISNLRYEDSMIVCKLKNLKIPNRFIFAFTMLQLAGWPASMVTDLPQLRPEMRHYDMMTRLPEELLMAFTDNGVSEKQMRPKEAYGPISCVVAE